MKNILLILFLFIPFISLGQKKVVLGTRPQKVPYGKKWELSITDEILLEVNSGTLNSGTACNARFLSNPRIVSGIVEGEYGRPNNVYGIIFKNFVKGSMSGNKIFKVNALTFVDKNTHLSDLRYTKAENLGTPTITFYSGQKLYVTECLAGITFYEYDYQNYVIQKVKSRGSEEMEDRRKAYEEKKRLEEEYENKVKKSNHYFRFYELFNKELGIKIEKEALTILYQYMQALKNKNPEDYEKYKLKKSEEGFRFSLHFGKSGELNEVFINSVHEISPVILEKLKALIKHEGGFVKIDQEVFYVNSLINFYLLPKGTGVKQYYFKVTKNGNIKNSFFENFEKTNNAFDKRNKLVKNSLIEGNYNSGLEPGYYYANYYFITGIVGRFLDGESDLILSYDTNFNVHILNIKKSYH